MSLCSLGTVAQGVRVARLLTQLHLHLLHMLLNLHLLHVLLNLQLLYVLLNLQLCRGVVVLARRKQLRRWRLRIRWRR